MRFYVPLVILFLMILFIDTSLATSSLEALRKLQDINRALKGTVERMKQEGVQDKRQAEERMKQTFQEKLKKVNESPSAQDDRYIELGLRQCEDLKKRKEELSASAGKKIITGALIGAGIGAAAAGKDRRSEGAILGALAGVVAATAHEIWSKKDLFEESADKVAKRVKYSPDNGVYLKISKLDFDKKAYKDNEDATLIMRVELLTPDYQISEEKQGGMLGKITWNRGNKEDVMENSTFYDIKILAFLIRNNQEILIAEENYSIPMGSNPFLYVFPVCQVIPKGVYELKFRVIHREVKDEKVVSFEKI